MSASWRRSPTWTRASRPWTRSTAQTSRLRGDQYSTGPFDGLLDPGDSDHFSVEVTAGQRLYLCAYTQEYGSVLDERLKVIDVDGSTVLVSGDAVYPNCLQTGELRNTGTVVVRVESEDGAGGPGYYYLGSLERWISERPR